MWFHTLLLIQARQIRKRFDYLRKLFSQGIYDRLHDASLGGRKRGADEVNAIASQREFGHKAIQTVASACLHSASSNPTMR